MQSFDVAVLEAFGSIARRSELLDSFAVMAAYNNLLKGGVAVAGLLALWFGGSEETRERRRATILATLTGTAVALGFNRALATWLPFRVRPINDPGSGFVAPFGIEDVHAFSDLSALPSDHAVMFVALATGALLVSRRVGLLLLLHAATVVLPVRLYLGLHWASDLLAGSLLGAVFALAFVRTPLREWIARPLLSWERRHPASFHALLFLVLLEFAVLFDGCVRLGYFVLRAVGHSGVL